MPFSTKGAEVPKAREFIRHDPRDKQAWICLCGNTPLFQGFYPCDVAGNQVEPNEKSGWTDLYICNQCDRIIKQGTLELVGRKTDTILTRLITKYLRLDVAPSRHEHVTAGREQISHGFYDKGYGWRCLCGNTPHEDGYAACTQTGDPIRRSRHWQYFMCRRCGRVIEQGALFVIGRASGFPHPEGRDSR